MRKQTGFLLCCCTLLLFFAACQPTPDAEAVVNKGDGVYEQKIDIAMKAEVETSAAPMETLPYDFEPHWIDTVSLRNFNVTIDVDVEATTEANFPVYRVKSSQFEAQDQRIRTVCEMLMGDVVSARSGGPTVQDYKEWLEQLQLGEYNYETDTWQPYDAETLGELSKEILDQLQTAPDENDFSSVAGVQLDDVPASYVYKNEEGVLWELSYAENRMSLTRLLQGIMQKESWVMNGNAISGEPKGTTLQNVSCTEEEARRYAETFFNTVDIGDMAISEMEKGRVVDADTLEILKEGWIVTCARRGGTCNAANYKHSSTSGSLRYSDDAYSAGLNAESIVLFVDDEGVAKFTWESPLEIVTTEVSNIEILPYAQAQELMKQAIINGLSWTGNKETGSAFHGAHVLRVVLSYCYIPVKDNPDEFYFTPTWFVFMQFDGMGDSVRDFVFALNAVDGTRIDLSSVS